MAELLKSSVLAAAPAEGQAAKLVFRKKSHSGDGGRGQNISDVRILIEISL
jgi:hypothetical protein